MNEIAAFGFFDDEVTPNSVKGSDTGDDDRSYLTFFIGAELYCTRLLAVREIVEFPKTKPLPNTLPHFLGLFNLRGEISGLIDLRKKFGMSSETAAVRRPVILFDTPNGPLGVVVDRMHRVISIMPDEVQPTAAVRTKIPQDYVEGFANVDDHIVAMLTLEKILGEDELAAFQHLRKSS